MKRFAVAACFALAVTTFVAAPARAATKTIFINNFRFCTTPVCTDNEDVTIAVGDTVQWVFADPACVALTPIGCYHTATERENRFDTDPMLIDLTGGSEPSVMEEVTFDEAGTYEYYCRVHDGAAPPLGPMNARIVVQ